MQALDAEINQSLTDVMKAKEREERRKLMETVQEAKSRVTKVLAILRANTNSQLGNATIAELNDVGYRGIRKQGQQRKLDERAMKNEAIFAENESKLKAVSANFDAAKLREQHKDLIAELGDCPMSQCDVVDLLMNGDCMCLTLDVGRSEACIQDPSKLVIKEIFPTFMSMDMFLESSLFHLRHDGDAGSGGFDYKRQGQLAVGVGRENVTGVLPLYLFREHKEVCKLKQGPLYGFLCTLDPMGFAVSQAFTVPFLVLQKAIADVAQEPTEARKRVLKLVLETCVNLLEF